MSGATPNADKAKKFNGLVELEDTDVPRRHRRIVSETGKIDNSYIIGLILARYSTDKVFRTEPGVNLYATDPEFFYESEDASSASAPLGDKTNISYANTKEKGWKLKPLERNPDAWNKIKSADEYLGLTPDNVEVASTMNYLSRIIPVTGRAVQHTYEPDMSTDHDSELDEVQAHFEVPEEMHFRPAPPVRRITGEVVERTYGIHPRKLRQSSGNYGIGGTYEDSGDSGVSGIRPVFQRRTSSLNKVMTLGQDGSITEDGHDQD